MILAILQARMSSTRLPGKALRPLSGAPMLLRQIERLRRSERIERLVVATSDDKTDDVLADVVRDAGVEVYRGSLDDVLGRCAGALQAFGPADPVVRLTGDCPLADWEVIDRVIGRHLESPADYTANTYGRRTFPKGLDVDVVTSAALQQAADEGEVRWTVDRPDDYDFVSAVYDALYPADPAFTSEDVRGLVSSRPELQRLGGDRRI